MNNERIATFPSRLREAIEAAGMRPVDLVEKTKIPKSMLSYYLNGKTKPKSDRLYIIAQALDVSEAWLMGFDVPKARTPDQKKNDQLAKLVVKLRADAEFFETVETLAELDEAQYQSIRQLIITLKK